MDEDRFWMPWSLAIALIVLTIFMLISWFKYEVCMETKDDHSECVYDVACNS